MHQILKFQAHKLTLAEGSPWFHKLFQSGENTKDRDVVLFGVSDKVVQATIDIIYGKEIIFPYKEKQRLTWFLNKLGVKWCDKETLDDAVTSPSCSLDPAPSGSNPQTSEMEPPKTLKLKSTEKQLDGSKEPAQQSKTEDPKSSENQLGQIEEEEQNKARQNEFYEILDKFTETNAEELAKISHMLIGEDGKPDRRYKCLNCEKSSNFFTQAQRHHLEHKHNELSFARETLKGVFTKK